MKKVLIIGGGASGLMAAIAAAEQGAKVTLLEKNKQTGKKLLVTGNGRCNFTNKDQKLEHYRSEAPEFVREALSQFSMGDTVRFFEKLGIRVKDRNGYLYPASGQAASIAEVLRLEALRQGVKLACNTEVLEVHKKDGQFQVVTEGWTYEGDALILACGSKAAPDTGTVGDGYRFAESFGHSVVTPLPALTGLCASEKDCGKLTGVRTDAKATLTVEPEHAAYEEEGEIQFAAYGLSGIPVFQLSRYAARALEHGGSCQVTLDLCQEHIAEELEEILKDKAEFIGERTGTDVLLGMFPEKLSDVILKRAGISMKKKSREWKEADWNHLIGQIKKFTFHITRCRGYEQAQVCTGGVPLAELKNCSMESAKVPGLYLCGELLDVDGACGGYNLQWAWTSGYLAGNAAGSEE